MILWEIKIIRIECEEHMKLLKPHYYDKFKCVGNNCPNTCCKGWDISINKKIYQKYQSVKGEFGDKLRKSIYTKNEEQYFKLNQLNACQFLNDKMLCDIYINLGENFMCDTCKIYPRITKLHADVVEQTLTLSCPEVARLLIESKSSIEFEYGDIYRINLKPEIVDDSLFNCLLHIRTLFIDILQKKEIKFLYRKLLLVIVSDKIQSLLNKKEYDEVEILIDRFYDDNYINLYIEQFQHIQANSNKELKYNFISNYIENVFKHSLNDEDYIMKLYNKFIVNDPDMTFEKILHKYEALFDKYYEENSYVYENFYVHTIFRYCLDALEDGQILKHIILTNLGYIIIHAFDVLSWIDNNKILTETNQCLIMGAFSFAFEHNINNFENIYNFLELNNMTSLAFQALLLN